MAIRDPVRLGLMPPLTGIVSLYGEEIARAAQVACDEINEAGGILGRRLELVVEDDGSLPQTAVPAAQRLIDDHGCTAIVGNLLSNSRIAVATQVAEPRAVPYLNFSFYEGSIQGRYFFHFAALPNQQIDKMIPYMAGRFGPKMFFAGNNYEWPRGSIDAARRALLSDGGEVVGEQYLPLGAPEEDISRLLTHMSKSGADVFVPYFAGADQLCMLRRFAALGLHRKVAVVMGHYDEAMVSRLSPEVRRGLYSTNTYFMSVQSECNRRVLSRIGRGRGEAALWPRGPALLTNFGEGAYVCVHAFAAAARAAGSVEREAIVSALEHVSVDAPQGVVRMDPRTHHAAVNAYLARCEEDGTFSLIERFGQIPPRIPERYAGGASQVELPEPSPPSPRSGMGVLSSSLSPREALASEQVLLLTDTAVLVANSHGTITGANPAACELFGYGALELVGSPVSNLVPPHLRARHAEHVKRFVDAPEVDRRMAQRSEVSGYRKDGTFFPMDASIAKFRKDDEWTLVVTMRDTTERQRVEDELKRRATHDPLTGLPNRALIRERLSMALERARRTGHQVGVLYIDLDGFKAINDSRGHEFGDAVIVRASSRILACLRPGDTVARLAGDEFVVVCEHDVTDDSVVELAECINVAMREVMSVGPVELYLSASIGIVTDRGVSRGADDLLRAADTAMYSVKERGRDGHAVFGEALEARLRDRLAITQGLRHALDNQELSCRYQAVVDVQSGAIAGVELLLRWSPVGGEVSPSIFVPLAEMSGSIVPIGSWVFRQGCLLEVELRARYGANAPYVSVNISARQLDAEGLVGSFAKHLAETGADGSRILLEITETALMANIDANLRAIGALSALGLSFAVDDFGAGYSSLAQLIRLPVRVLKIDRMFIENLEVSRDSRTVVRAVIGLGRALGLSVVAEGVESARQLSELRQDECDFAQGYHLGRPVKKEEFLAMVDEAMGKQM